MFPWFKKLASLSTLVLVAFTVVLYGKELLDALGSFAVAAQVLFIVVLGLLAYVLGFGMDQAQRSALSLGVCSRNGGAMFVAFTAFTVHDPTMLVMILLAVPVPVVVWLIMARYYASKADAKVAA